MDAFVKLAPVHQNRDQEISLLQIPFKSLADEKSIEAHFEKLADTLINDAVLVAGGVRHRIAELEFYYHTAVLPDPFPHGTDLQRTSAQWYFHRTGGTYRSGTFKGLDITIGSDEKNFGGILLRSLEVLDGGNILCGPCVSVDHILKCCKAENIKTLVDDQLKGDITISPQPNKALYLEISPAKKLPKRPIMRSARVGLHMNKASVPGDIQKHFVFKPYRFFIQDKKINKGRVLAILQLASEGKTPGEIHTSTFATLASQSNVLAAFEEGKKKGKADSYVGSKFTDDDIPYAFGAIFAEENKLK